MEQKLYKLFLECINELNKIGIDILNEKQYGKIDISISKRNNKRYGCCKQEEPDKKYKIITKIGRRKVIRYEKFEKHHIEISKWVLELEDNIIKNTIMHELIHCIPYCNNHGKEFKKYAKLINEKYDYDISRVGDKKKDFEKSNLVFTEIKTYNYKIICKGCKQEFYRQRLNRSFTRKYRCGKCGSTFEVFRIVERGKN
ncbi:MAG: SprT-like domain-containing protein [Clostridia bacterium]|nr:SprT-like domain-containing protein [Clostridia bacterium]